MRLIDADSLIAEWYKLNKIGPEDCGARFVGYQEIARLINNAPTAQPTGDLISRADAICEVLVNDGIDNIVDRINALPPAEAVTIHEDGTLEIKVPNAQKVGRVLVMDTDSHIGGGLFYPDDAEAEWIPCSERLPREKDGQVLVTKHGEVSIATYSEFSGTWYVGEMCAVGGEDPIAWKPLPKPYREESEAEE